MKCCMGLEIQKYVSLSNFDLLLMVCTTYVIAKYDEYAVVLRCMHRFRHTLTF